jgi:hypothetical protein
MMTPTLDLLVSQSRVAKVLSFANVFRSQFRQVNWFRKSLLLKQVILRGFLRRVLET